MYSHVRRRVSHHLLQKLVAISSPFLASPSRRGCIVSPRCGTGFWHPVQFSRSVAASCRGFCPRSGGDRFWGQLPRAWMLAPMSPRVGGVGFAACGDRRRRDAHVTVRFFVCQPGAACLGRVRGGCSAVARCVGGAHVTARFSVCQTRVACPGRVRGGCSVGAFAARAVRTVAVPPHARKPGVTEREPGRHPVVTRRARKCHARAPNRRSAHFSVPHGFSC